MLHADQIGEGTASTSGKNEGILKTGGQEYSIFVFSDSEAVTEAVAKFLQEANQQGASLEQLLDYEFVHITQEMIEVESEVELLLNQLAKQEISKEEGISLKPQDLLHGKENLQSLKKSSLSNSAGKDVSKSASQAASNKSEVVYSSLFSLARSFHATLSENKQKKGPETPSKSEGKEEARPAPLQQPQVHSESLNLHERQLDREGNGKQEQGQKQDEENEGHAQHQEQQQEQKNKGNKKNKIVPIRSVQASRNQSGSQLKASTSSSSQSSKSSNPTPSIDNVYIRFMALMARILGQAEYEAHQLYLRIKDRTDAIDVLTLLISKLNSEKAGIDWTNNEEMKKLIDKARALGVDIPEGKYKWTDDEKKLLKENVQMRKDSMEKITQLERTDMQRYLQEASQCHQARSNTLKLLKEVTDTIIHNMRPS